MNYLYGYLVVGVIDVLVVYIYSRLSKPTADDELLDILESMNPDRERFAYQLIKKFLAPTLAALFVIAVWPYAIYRQLENFIRSKRPVTQSPEETETVLPEPIPTFEEMERKLADRKWDVRWSVAWDKQYKPTEKQIERGLRDKERQVRVAFGNRRDLTLTPRHIEMGLTDKDDAVRGVFLLRDDYILTPEQLERGLTDKSNKNRLHTLGRKDCVLAPAQIERGLTDKDCFVRWDLAERKDFTPTAAQIERGLTDSYCEVRYWHLRGVRIYPSLRPKSSEDCRMNTRMCAMCLLP